MLSVLHDMLYHFSRNQPVGVHPKDYVSVQARSLDLIHLAMTYEHVCGPVPSRGGVPVCDTRHRPVVRFIYYETLSRVELYFRSHIHTYKLNIL